VLESWKTGQKNAAKPSSVLGNGHNEKGGAQNKERELGRAMSEKDWLQKKTECSTFTYMCPMGYWGTVGSGK